MTASWLEAVRARVGAGGDLVSVVVATAEGSAPREPGAWMLVDGDGQTGTIGGGRLEWEATCTAREFLAVPHSPWLRDLRDYPLGPDLEQCCGGFVRLFYERIGPQELAGLQADAPAGGLILHPLASGRPLKIVTDRRAAKALPLPAAKTAAEILSGQAPRATVLIETESESWLLCPIEGAWPAALPVRRRPCRPRHRADAGRPALRHNLDRYRRSAFSAGRSGRCTQTSDARPGRSCHSSAGWRVPSCADLFPRRGLRHLPRAACR